MGAVFVGEHVSLERRVAIKVLNGDRPGDEALSRFFTEARAMSLIRHPNIVEVFDCGVDPDAGAYIIMELLEGETLWALLKRQGPLAHDLGGALAVAMQAA